MSVVAGFFDRLFLLFGSIGIVLSFAAGIILVIRTNRSMIWNLFLGIYLLTLGLRMAKSLFHYYYTISTTIHTMFLTLFLVIGPSVWLYTITITQQNNTLRLSEFYRHYFILFLALVSSFFIPGYGEPYAWVFYVVLFSHGILYCSYSLYWINKNARLFNIDNKGTKLKNWLMLLIFVTILIFINAIFIYNQIIPFYLSSYLVFTVAMIALTVCMLKNLWLLKPIHHKYKGSALSSSFISEYAKKLEQLMAVEKLFLNPNLTLQKLSDRIGITSKQLSQLINQTKHNNFSQYVSELRVKEAMGTIKNDKLRKYKIAAIAYESGFNSISSFNAAFKKITQQTPVAYRNSFIELEK